MKIKSLAKSLLVVSIIFSLSFGNAVIIFAQSSQIPESENPELILPDDGSQSSSSFEEGGQDFTPSYERENAGLGRVTSPLNSYSGSYSYQIPFKIPPGRNGTTPDLSLLYSSQNHSEDDIFGYGWDISIPYIERFNNTGLNHTLATTSTSFYSSLSGELVPASVNGVVPTSVTNVFYPIKDGSIYNFQYGVNSWAPARNASSGITVESTEGPLVSTHGCDFDDTNDHMTRSAFIFDTSSIPSGNLISSALLNLYINSWSVDEPLEGTSGSLVVTHPTVSSTGAVALSDYSLISENLNNPLEGAARYFIPHLSTTEYNPFILNDLGKGWIGKGGGGLTKLGMRDSWDVINACGFVVDDWVHTRFSGYSGTNYDPKLIVTHIPPVEQYVARNDDGSALKYTFQNNIWTISDKSGKTYFFGTSTIGRQDDPNGSGKINKWMLQQVIDTNGNTIDYAYFKDSGQIYPSTITYTGTATTTGVFAIDFIKSLRTIPTATSTDTGFNVKTKYKIDQIVAKFNGNTVHKYDFTYNNGDNGSRLRLSTIIETGQQEIGGAVLSLPATSFSYSNSTKNSVATSWSIPGNIYSRFVDDNIDRGIIMADVNGDGLSDMVQAHQIINAFGTTTTLSKYVNLNNGSGWTADSGWTFPYCTFTKVENGYAQDGGGRLVDVNGDHLPDYVCEKSVYLNNGHTWGATSTLWSLPVSIVIGDVNSTLKFADVNGDRMVDIVQAYKNRFSSNPDFDKHIRKIYLNTGVGWIYDPSFVIPTAIIFGSTYGNDYTDNGIQLVDVNNDGMADFVSGRDVYINSSTSWSLDPTWQTSIDMKGIGQRIFDISGDGLPDLISASSTQVSGGGLIWKSNKVYLNTGVGWTLDNDRTMVNPFELNGEDTGARIADLNGDTLADLIYYGQGTAGLSWSYNVQYFSQGDQPDLIKSTNESSGRTTSVAYKATPQYRDGSNNMLNPSLPFSLMTVASIQTYDGLATTTTETYKYKDGSYYFASSTDRRFAGFDSITKTDSIGNISKIFYHQGNTTASSSGEYLDDQSKIGKVYRVENRDLADNLYSLTINKWDLSSRGGLANFVQLVRSTSLDYDGDSDHKDKSETYGYATTTGSLLQKVEWGEVTGSTDGSFTDTLSDKRTTDITYSASSTGYLILPSNQITTDQGGTKISESKYYYDNQSLGSITKGNLTKQEDWKSGSTYINNQKTYNSYGLVTQSTDPRGKNTTYVYDSKNLYPATTTNALNQSTTYTYDYSSGKVLQTVDLNGNVFQSVLDPLDRLIEEKQPDLTTPSTLVTKATYAYTDNTMPRLVQKTSNLDGTNSHTSYTYLDGFGRKLEERVRSEDTNTYSVKDYSYDSRGNLKTESLPFFGTDISYTGISSPAIGNLLVNYSYDPLSRVVSVANAIGTTTNAYDDWKLSTTDPNGKIKHIYKDAYGRLTKVEEIDGASTYTTNYEYNGNNNLTKITDATSNIRNFTYDGLGRRLTAQDLHDISDGTFGTWSYVYDDSSNIASTTDPKNQVIDYSYDDINRILTENYTGAGGTEVSYGYDFCARGKGKLCVATTTDAITKLEYNPIGLVKKETKTINSTNYVTEYNYNRLGAPTSIIYPDLSEVAYTYNAGNLLEKVEQKESGGSFKGVVRDFDYTPVSKVAFKEFGNGITSTYTYDPDKLYRLTNILTSASETVAGGGLGFVNFSNFKNLFAKGLDYIFKPFKLLAFSGFGKLALETLDLATSPEEIIVEQVEDLVQNPISVEEVSTTSIPAYVSTKGEIKVVVGNKDSKVFEPKVTLGKLGESSISLSYPTRGESLSKVTFEQDKIVWSEGKEKVRFFNLPKSEELPEGGYEVDVVFSEKPTTNIVTFNLETSNLEYLYQGALTEEEINEGDYRPEKVIGSYAVYYKDSQLGTGKAFHIYRPKIYDNAGKTTWGELNIDEKAGKLTVVVPQEFLDSAEYPVTVDPTFGYTTAGATLGTITDGIIRLSATHSAPETGTINTVHFYSGYSGSGTNCLVRPVLYKDSDLSLVTYGGQNSYSTPAPGTEEWKTLDISDSAITSGVNYNIGVWVNSTSGGNGCRYRYDTNASYSLKSDTYTYHATNAPVSPAVIDSTLSSRRMSLYATYTASSTNSAPTAPSSLQTEGQTNPTNITDPTPEFSAIYSDPDSGDLAIYYRLQVATSSSFTSPYWDSGTTTMATTTAGNRSSDISYTGSILASSTTYYWRILFSDDSGATGAWSTTTSTFSLAPANSNQFVETIQNISYTYDNVGNITKMADNSGTGAGKSLIFTYDDLHRLMFASTTMASSTPFKQAYAYSSLGNMTGKKTDSSATSTYSYAETNYANPHAPTNIGGTPLSYDNNGNLTSYSSKNYIWDYRNRMTASGESSATTTYAYDHTEQRVKKVGNGVTTIYPNKYYNIEGTTITKYIFAGDELVASIKGGSGGGTPLLDTTSTSITNGFNAGPTTKTWTHTVTGQNPLITLSADIFQDVAGTGSITSATWNGGVFTKATSTRLGTKSAEMWYLVATTTGAKIMSVTITGATDEIKLSASSFTNITPTSPLDSVSVSTGSSGNPSVNLTTSTTNDLVVTTLHRHSTTDATTNRTSLYKNTSGSTLGASSYQLATSPNSYSDTYTGSANQNWAMVIASFKPASGSTATSTTYIHSDHLGSTNATTDATGYTTKVLDYYPYGNERISSGSDTQQRTYIGQMYDPESSLSYLNARYYNPVTTQFLSQDPIFWSSSQDLSDPQSLNSYSYALNNPVNRKDPSGKASIVAALKSLVSALQSFVNSLRGGGSSSGSSSNSSSQSSNSGKSTQIQPPGGWVTQQRSTGCFDACADMAGYRPKAENRIVTSTFVNGALTTQSDAKQGIQTIDNYIANGKTPIVGVNVNGGTNSDNANRATQHFVVIVGSGVDNGGKYYNFYDPGTSYESKGASPDNKLYLNGDILSGKSVYNQNTATYVVTEVRPQ